MLPCRQNEETAKMKLQYTAQELAMQFAALEQLFGKAVLVDPPCAPCPEHLRHFAHRPLPRL